MRQNCWRVRYTGDGGRVKAHIVQKNMLHSEALKKAEDLNEQLRAFERGGNHYIEKQ